MIISKKMNAVYFLMLLMAIFAPLETIVWFLTLQFELQDLSF